VAIEAEQVCVYFCVFTVVNRGKGSGSLGRSPGGFGFSCWVLGLARGRYIDRLHN